MVAVKEPCSADASSRVEMRDPATQIMLQRSAAANRAAANRFAAETTESPSEASCAGACRNFCEARRRSRALRGLRCPVNGRSTSTIFRKAAELFAERRRLRAAQRYSNRSSGGDAGERPVPSALSTAISG